MNLKYLSNLEVSNSRKYLLFPTILSMYLGKKVLDIGCAEGHLVELIADNEKIDYCLGIDKSPQLIEKANFRARNLPEKKRRKLEYAVMDCLRLKIDNQSYNTIIIAHVLCMLKNEDLIIRALKESQRVMESDGNLIVSVPHPAFDSNLGSKVKLQFKEEYEYFKSGLKCTATYFGEERKIELIDYHYTIEDYIRIFLKSGFKLEKLVEPKPDSTIRRIDPEWFDRNNKSPSIIVFNLRKEGLSKTTSQRLVAC